MPDNLDFIMFAIKQAKEAEKYGFKRNVCCRNLKIALRHYWQHKTMGMSQKKNMPRSKTAEKENLKNCIGDHAVPQMVIVNYLMDKKKLSKKELKQYLTDFYRVCVITKKENEKLRQNELNSRMPKDWDGKDVWARYRKVGIIPLSHI